MSHFSLGPTLITTFYIKNVHSLGGALVAYAMVVQLSRFSSSQESSKLKIYYQKFQVVLQYCENVACWGILNIARKWLHTEIVLNQLVKTIQVLNMACKGLQKFILLFIDIWGLKRLTNMHWDWVYEQTYWSIPKVQSDVKLLDRNSICYEVVSFPFGLLLAPTSLNQFCCQAWFSLMAVECNLIVS